MLHDSENPLHHIFWLGGSACAGKTSVALLLARRYGLRLYHCDQHFEAHRLRADPRRHARFRKIMDRAPEELLAPPVAQQVADLVGFYEDELEMVIEDLLELPQGTPMLVEGAGLLPAGLAARICLDRALWLISTAGLRHRLHPRRGPWVDTLLSQCRDPRRAQQRWLARDDGFAEHIADGARRVGGQVLLQEGRRSVEEIAEEVARFLFLQR